MSLFESFLGHAAGTGAQIIGDQMKNDTLLKNEREVMKMREELAIEREKTTIALREAMGIRTEQRAQEREEAPLKRMGSLVNKYRDQETPIEAAPVTSLTGQGTSIDGQALKSGLQGDPTKMRAIAMGMPDGEDKTNILKQLDSQMATDTATNKAAVAGKTRKMSTEEAQKAAMDDAMANDPVAYASYQKNIGKPLRDERRIDVAEGRAQSQDEFNRARYDRLDRLDAIKTSAAEARAARTEGKQDASMEKAELQSQRTSVTSLMTSTERELERNMTLMNSAMDPAEKKLYQDRANRLTKDLSSYRTALESFSGGRMPTREPESAGSDVKYDAKGNAYVRGPDGKPMLRDAPKEQPSAATTAPTAAKPAQTEAAQPEPEKSKKAPSALDDIESKNLESLRGLSDQVKQAQAQLAAVAKSGDPVALQKYAKELQELRGKLEREAGFKFGNGASAALAKLG